MSRIGELPMLGYAQVSKPVRGCDVVNCRKPAKWGVKYTSTNGLQTYDKDYCDAHCPTVEEL
jgi:hypothetical protein